MNKDEFEYIKNLLDKADFIKQEKGVYVDTRMQDYSSSFGLQWNEFPLTQYDSETGFPLTKNRLVESSEWSLNEIKNKLIIELGRGAGRFTEILLSAGGYVVSVDMSDAIFTNSKNNKSDKVIFIRSSLTDLKYLNKLFDFVLCYGVAQHTPNLFNTYKSCFEFGKAGSKISIDHYLKVYYPSPKYIWRPITKRLNADLLLKIIRFYIPYYFPIDTFLKTKFPLIVAKILRRCIPIPCWNYSREKNVPQEKSKLIEWAVMDTFDGLSAKYDNPLRHSELEKIAKEINPTSYEIKRGGTGLVLNIIK